MNAIWKLLENKKIGVLVFYTKDFSDINDLRNLYQQSKNGSSGFLFPLDAKFHELKILEANPSYEKDISEMPLEQSKVINDNIRLKPKKLNMKVLISNYNSGIISLSAFNTAAVKLGLVKGEVATKLDEFKRMHEEGLMCDITLMTREYQNMQLTSYSFTEDPQNRGKYLIVDMQWQEMMLFEILEIQDSKRISTTLDNGAGYAKNKGILK